jgi:hypothetical protein
MSKLHPRYGHADLKATKVSGHVDRLFVSYALAAKSLSRV